METATGNNQRTIEEQRSDLMTRNPWLASYRNGTARSTPAVATAQEHRPSRGTVRWRGALGGILVALLLITALTAATAYL